MDQASGGWVVITRRSSHETIARSTDDTMDQVSTRITSSHPPQSSSPSIIPSSMDHDDDQQQKPVYLTTWQLIDWLVYLGAIYHITATQPRSSHGLDKVETTLFIDLPGPQRHCDQYVVIRFDKSCQVTPAKRSRNIQTWQEMNIAEESPWTPLWHLIIHRPRVGMLWTLARSEQFPEDECFNISRVPMHNDDARQHQHEDQNEPWVVPLMPFAYDHLKHAS